MAATCRWCDPPGFDSSVRDALRWHDTDTANIVSYVVPLAVEVSVSAAVSVTAGL